MYGAADEDEDEDETTEEKSSTAPTPKQNNLLANKIVDQTHKDESMVPIPLARNASNIPPPRAIHTNTPPIGREELGPAGAQQKPTAPERSLRHPTVPVSTLAEAKPSVVEVITTIKSEDVPSVGSFLVEPEPELTRRVNAKSLMEEWSAPANSSNRPIGSDLAIGLPVSGITAAATVKRPSRDAAEHLSFECHLAPRLSESGLQFHDIHWSYEGREMRPLLRKRIVKFCKLLRFTSLNSPLSTSRSNASLAAAGVNEAAYHYRLELSLVDQRPKAHQQIVSNVLNVEAPLVLPRLAASDSRANTTLGRILVGGMRKPRPKSILVRSNYAQPEVALRIALLRYRDLPQGGEDAMEEVVGRVELSLLESARPGLGEDGQRVHTFGNELRLQFGVEQLPEGLLGEADSLPDVLLCTVAWVPMLAQYRRILCEQLAWQMELPPPYKGWAYDPLLATLPRMLDMAPELAEAFRNMLLAHSQRQRKMKSQKYGSGSRISDGDYRAIYMSRILPLLAVTQRIESTKAAKDPIAALWEEQQRPLEPADCCIRLIGGLHAID